MSEVHPWTLDKDNTEVNKTVPNNKTRFGISNSASSKDKIIWYFNGKEQFVVEPGNEFSDMACGAGDKLKIETVIPGREAKGAFVFD